MRTRTRTGPPVTLGLVGAGYVHHLMHLDVFDSAGDAVANAISLGIIVVVPLAVLWGTRTWPRSNTVDGS